MISWHIWQSLHTPFVAHPIFWLRGFTAFEQDTNSILKRVERRRWLILSGVFILSIGLLLFSGFGTMLTFLIGLPVIIILVGIPVGLSLAGSVYGLICAGSAATTISRERYQGRYQLLGITPWGLAGATWALGSIAIQRNRSLSHIRSLLYPIYAVMSMSAFVLLLALVLSFLMGLSGDAINNTATPLLIILLLFADFIQATSIGALSGMLVSVSINQLGATLVGVTLFYLLSQLAIIVISGIIWFVVWPLLSVEMGLGWYLAGASTLVAMRETAILLLWHRLLRVMNSDFDELDRIVHISFWKWTN